MKQKKEPPNPQKTPAHVMSWDNSGKINNAFFLEGPLRAQSTGVPSEKREVADITGNGDILLLQGKRYKPCKLSDEITTRPNRLKHDTNADE